MRSLTCLSLLALGLMHTPLLADEPEGKTDEKGFMSLQPNGTSEGWAKGVFVTEDGYLDGDGRYTARQFGDFVLRFDFRLKPGANSGVGIRTAATGDPAYDGMEVQVLDHNDPRYASIKPWQCHGSIYGVVAAKKGFLKKPGEWNTEEIRAVGDRIKVTLNGHVIVDADIRKASKDGTIDNRTHPGLLNPKGYIGLCGHGGGVQFRNLRIKPLDGDEAAAKTDGETATDKPE